MEKFSIRILGCGSALPTLRHFNSSQVLNIREKLFMIDCGEGTQIQLRKSKLKFSHINTIFISHLHGDHCFGLIGLISTFGLLGRTSDLHIYSPIGLKNVLQPQLDFFCRGNDYKVLIHEVDHTKHALIYDDRSVSVYTIPLKHRIPCCGFLFKEKATLPHIRRDMIDFLKVPIYAINKIKNGADWEDEDGRVWENSCMTLPAAPARSYAYCSDTAFLPQNAPMIRGVDLLYHESTFSEEDALKALKTFHSTAKQAGEMAKKAEVKRLLLGHYSSRYIGNEAILLKEAQTVFPNTMLADEMNEICL